MHERGNCDILKFEIVILFGKVFNQHVDHSKQNGTHTRQGDVLAAIRGSTFRHLHKIKYSNFLLLSSSDFDL